MTQPSWLPAFRKIALLAASFLEVQAASKPA
jgi:hypothetical protein